MCVAKQRTKLIFAPCRGAMCDQSMEMSGSAPSIINDGSLERTLCPYRAYFVIIFLTNYPYSTPTGSEFEHLTSFNIWKCNVDNRLFDICLQPTGNSKRMFRVLLNEN